MHNSDKPINNLKLDVLNRADFSVKLAKAIIKYNYQDSLTVGLVGEWGTGKSSVINMMLDHINNFVDDEEKPVIIYFNPWNYSEQYTLIHHFFDSLLKGLKKNKVKRIREIGDNLYAYSNFLRPAKYIPGIGQFVDTGLDLAQAIGSTAQKQDKRDLEDFRERLNKLLSKVKSKILIVIDDIDRLSSLEIKQIFQLVKKLADFPNTIYLLSFSMKIVVGSLKEIQVDDGYDYLKKIVQLQFNIPAANPEDIERYLFNGLNEILEKVEKDFDKTYWGLVYTKSIKYFFKTLRDVNRFLNIFRFKIELLKGEVNPIDLIAITVVEVFAPTLFQYMQSNKEKFAEDEINQSIILGAEVYKKNLKTDFDALLINENIITLEYREVIKKLLISIFPKWDVAFETYYAHSQANQGLIDKKCRVASAKFYDRYFYLSVPISQLSKTEFESIISDLKDSRIIENKLLNISNRALFKEFLYRLEIDTEMIDLENIANIIDVIINKSDQFQFKNEFGLAFLPNDLILLIAINNLLRLIDDKEKRFEIIYKSIDESKDSIYIPIKYIIDCSLQHGRFTDDAPIVENKQILDLNHVLKLEALGAKKLQEFADSGKLINSGNLPWLLYRWERFADKNDIQKFVSVTIVDNKNLASFIKGFRYSIDSNLTGIVTRSYSLHYNDLKYFVEVEKVEPQIRIIYTSRDTILTDEEIDALRLFLDFYDGKISERDY